MYVMPDMNVLATRGPDTLQVIQEARKKANMPALPDGSVALGDPGILLHHLGMDSGSCRQSQLRSCDYRFCFVSHAGDGGDFINKVVREHNFQRFSPFVTWDVMVRQLGTCQHVLCRSLHCIILSDAMNIPNVFFQFANTTNKEPIHKYRDYYGSFGISRDDMPYFEDAALAMEYLEGNKHVKLQHHQARIDALYEAFPLSLFAIQKISG